MPILWLCLQEKEQLLNNIEKTTNDVNSLLGTTGKQMKEIVDTISETFLQNVWGDAEVLISDLESNVLLSAFMEFVKVILYRNTNT